MNQRNSRSIAPDADQSQFPWGGIFPKWVPQDIERYLGHTVAGLTIREVARQHQCHASTILRQIRRIEQRRDDPLVDRLLCTLGEHLIFASDLHSEQETDHMGHYIDEQDLLTDIAELDREALRVLRRLSETGAVLAVAKGMDTAVVVRESADGSTTRSLSVQNKFVEAMALNAWIDCEKPGRISRYHITAAGRSKLDKLVEELGTQEADTQPFADQHRDFAEKHVNEDGRRRRVRYNMIESPVTALARRRNKDGTPFLTDPLVTASERLREDFELAQMGPRVAQNWDKFMTAGARSSYSGQGGPATGPTAARDRVASALGYLGPGLADVALRCCCHLEGLESAEKRMGWSARSGKIVLRIALQRLNQFYTEEVGDVLIG